jgi:hypothetical protein
MTLRQAQGKAFRCDIAASDTIELYFYGELAPAERDAFEQHVTRCSDCRSALEELSLIRDALAARPIVAAPPAGDWSGFMTRLERAIERDGVRDAGSGIRDARSEIRDSEESSPIESRIPDPGSRRASYAGYLAMAALLALVTISVVFVARSRNAAIGTPPAIAERTPAPARGEDAAFAALSEEHFERSKLVVLGLATKDADRVTSGDWTYERQLATSLLSDTRMYRLAAEDRGLRSLAGVMRDLELVLLQTSLTDETDPASLAQIQRLIRKRDLLQKMDAVATAGL